MSLGYLLGSVIGTLTYPPVGAIVGGWVGNLIVEVIPPSVLSGGRELAKDVAGDLTVSVIERTGQQIVQLLSPEERKQINHDLQAAFRDALREALYDIGGDACFPKQLARTRPLPSTEVIYPQTPQAQSLWQTRDPLAEEIGACLRAMVEALNNNTLLPLDPAEHQPAAHVQRYLEHATPDELAGAFFNQIIAPFLLNFDELLQRRRDLRLHLRRYLLPRTLVHLGEFLKQRPEAWRAFNRMLLEGMRQTLDAIQTEQHEILKRLDELLARTDTKVLEDWSNSLADLLAATGSIEHQLAQGFDEVLEQLANHHTEVFVAIWSLKTIGLQTQGMTVEILRIVQEIRDTTGPQHGQAGPNTPPEAGPSPYKGMVAFDTGDAEWFFGREALTTTLINLLRKLVADDHEPWSTDTMDAPRRRFLTVIGASGSGKSSLVRAGLIPALQGTTSRPPQVPLPFGCDSWQIRVFRPGEQPLRALATELLPKDASVAAQQELSERLLGEPAGLHREVVALLHNYPRSERMLLVVDQFEELFTLCKNEVSRRAFVTALLTAASEPKGPTLVVITLRADFYGECSRYSELLEAVKQQEYIGPMTREQLQHAIVEPARRGRWLFEHRLVDLLLHDVGQEPGALPLLSHALLKTWDERRGRTMTLESYGTSGMVRGAIAQTADEEYNKLSPEQQAIARHIFLSLTELGEGTQDTRRPVRAAELLAATSDAPSIETVLQILTAKRLITINDLAVAPKLTAVAATTPIGATDTRTVEVAHEALIREWGTLRDWLKADREWLRFHRSLMEDARLWNTEGQNPERLYPDGLLAAAWNNAKGREGQIHYDAQAFLAASASAIAEEKRIEDERKERELAQAQELARMAAESEEVQRREAEVQRKLADEQRQHTEEQRKAAQRSKRWASGAGGAFVVALIAAVIAVFLGARAQDREQQAQISFKAEQVARKEADQSAVAAKTQQALALAQQLAAQASDRADDQPDLALLLGLEAVRITDTLQVRGGLLNGLTASPHLRTYLREHTNWVYSVAFDDDGQILASADLDGTILFWNPHDNIRTQKVVSEKSVYAIAFIPNGNILASGGGEGRVTLWDGQAGKKITDLVGHKKDVKAVVFSPDGKYLASSDIDGVIWLWDMSTHPVQPRKFANVGSEVDALAFNSESTLLAVGDANGTVHLLNIQTQEERVISASDRFIHSVAFSSNRKLATADSSGTIVIRDFDETYLHSSAPITLTGHTSRVYKVVFSADGKRLASSGDDRTVRLWDTTTGQQKGAPFTGHASYVWSVAFSPDGQTLASGGADQTVILWDVTAHSRLVYSTASYTQTILSIAYNQDGSMLALNGSDGSVVVQHTAEPDKKNTLPVGYDGAYATTVAFSKNNNMLAAGLDNGAVVLWEDFTKPASRKTFTEGRSGRIRSIAFSPDGTTLVAGGDNGRLIQWNIATGKPSLLQEHTGQKIYTVVFNPAGTLLAYGSAGNVMLWDLKQKQSETLYYHYNDVYSLAFSPDGNTLASGSADNTIRLWNVAEHTMIGDPLTRHTNAVSGLAFNQDGTVLVSSSYDDSVVVWDVDNQQPIGKVVVEGSGDMNSVQFSPDGTTLATASDDGSVIVRDITLGAWKKRACELAGRNLTLAEWRQYFGKSGPFYRATCLNIDLKTSELSAQVDEYVQAYDIATLKRFAASFREAPSENAKYNLYRTNQDICGRGVIYGKEFAIAVMEACEQAIILNSTWGFAHDYRGIARALTGDYKGAIEDFEYFVRWAHDPKQNNRFDKYIKKRAAWIDALKNNTNPFDEATLREVRDE